MGEARVPRSDGPCSAFPVPHSAFGWRPEGRARLRARQTAAAFHIWAIRNPQSAIRNRKGGAAYDLIGQRIGSTGLPVSSSNA